MKVVEAPLAMQLVNVTKIPVGKLLQYYHVSGEPGKVYIKAESPGHKSALCIDLRTGQTQRFRPGTLVRPRHGTLRLD